jgi:hypothetical protein
MPTEATTIKTRKRGLPREAAGLALGEEEAF